MLAALALSATLLGGCGGQISFEKVDYKGHVRIEQDGVGYCFRVPTDWEIRERLEGADVVCLAPLESGFRDSVVARSLSSADLQKPDEFISGQLESLGSDVNVVESWQGADKPVVTTLEKSKFAKEPLGQLMFLHLRPDGAGVLITCTTTKSQLEAKKEFFQKIVSKAKYDIELCAGPGGLPKTFPTPEVTLSPSP